MKYTGFGTGQDHRSAFPEAFFISERKVNIMKEVSFERVTNSKGESATIRHYIIESASEAAELPADAPVMSDALCKDGTVYIKFESGWVAI